MQEFKIHEERNGAKMRLTVERDPAKLEFAKSIISLLGLIN